MDGGGMMRILCLGLLLLIGCGRDNSDYRYNVMGTASMFYYTDKIEIGSPDQRDNANCINFVNMDGRHITLCGSYEIIDKHAR
jgi:hypothetical protein